MENNYIAAFVVAHRLKASISNDEYEIEKIQSRINAAKALLDKLSGIVESGARDFELNIHGYAIDLTYDPSPRRTA